MQGRDNRMQPTVCQCYSCHWTNSTALTALAQWASPSISEHLRLFRAQFLYRQNAFLNDVVSIPKSTLLHCDPGILGTTVQTDFSVTSGRLCSRGFMGVIIREPFPFRPVSNSGTTSIRCCVLMQIISCTCERYLQSYCTMATTFGLIFLL
jgi:hypothetical protein